MAGKELQPPGEGCRIIRYPSTGCVHQRSYVSYATLFQDGVLSIERSVRDHNCSGNLVVAACNRVIGDTGITVKPKAAWEYNRMADVLYRMVPARRLVPLTREAFLARYSGAKFTRYLKAQDEVRARGLSKRDSEAKAFIKDENNQLQNDKDPRMIQFRTYRYGSELGRYVKAIEGVFYAARGDGRIFPRTRFMAKGLNTWERASLLRAKWERFRDPVALLLDNSRHDKHCNDHTSKGEHRLSLKFFVGQDRQRFRNLLKQQLRNRVSSACGLVYQVNGRRLSGDFNTALGNTESVVTIDGCAMDRARQVLGDFEWDLLNDGDDQVIITERETSEIVGGFVVQTFRDHGFKMQLEGTTDVFEQIDFCRSRPVKLAGGWRMVRWPERLMSGALSSHKLSTYGERKRMFATIGLGELSCNAGVPMLQAFAEWMRKASEGAKPLNALSVDKFYRYKIEGVDFSAIDRKSEPITAEARDSFQKAYGISSEQQVAFEDALARNSIDLRSDPAESNQEYDFLTGRRVVVGRPECFPLR